MAASLHSPPSSFFPARNPRWHPPAAPRLPLIRCGSRDNRGPLVKGRVLSSEAILAVQSLKRADAHRRSPSHLRTLISSTVARLIKPDLLAAVNELLRQGRCALAGELLSAAAPSEPYADLAVYAEVVAAMGRSGLGDEIDRLICDLERQGAGIQCGDDKGLTKLIRAVVAAGRVESTVRIYGMMRRSGWGSTWVGDQFAVEALCKGLRMFGQAEVAREVEREHESVSKGSLGIMRL